jgi:hypothetical protein
MEILKGFGFLDVSFLLPIVIVAVVLIIVAKVAKSIFKIAILAAVIAVAAVVYMNLPSFKVENGTATLSLYGKEHTISAKNAKVISEVKNGEQQVVLVSGTEHIVLPFSSSFADKFIVQKLKEAK